MLNVVFFSPEDLSIIKNGPSERRRFVDMELCQLDHVYLHNLNHYNKSVNQRNRLLKDLSTNSGLKDTLFVWDSQLVSFGTKIIEQRKIFVSQLNEIIYEIHRKLSGGKEELKIVYEPDVSAELFEEKLQKTQERDIQLNRLLSVHTEMIFLFWWEKLILENLVHRGSNGQQRYL